MRRLYNGIREQMDENRAAEALRTLKNLENDNNDEKWFVDEEKDNTYIEEKQVVYWIIIK